VACDQQKAWLSDRNIPFTAKNIRDDAQAMAELQQLGVRACPVTVIDGEVIVGFDPTRTRQLLGLP
jgi:glutaredoxin